MQEEIPVAAQHQAAAKAHQTDRLIAQIVGFPAAGGHGAEAKQSVSDFTIGCVFEMGIERSEREDQTFTALL